MFIPSSSYRNELNRLIQNSASVRAAVAFWGKDSDTIFESIPNEGVRIICNLLSGGTNPEPIQKLRDRANIQVRRLDTLHAKVVLGERSAIVGSANLSTNGLNHERDEDPGWIEAGIRTDIREQLKEIGDWFESQWSLASEISDADLVLAEKIWKLKRNNRTEELVKKSIFDYPVSSFRDRSIFIAMYKGEVEQEAENTFEKIKNASAQNIPETVAPSNLSFCAQWDDLPTDSSIILIYVGPRGGAKVDGVFRRLPALDSPYKKNKSTHRIQVIVRENHILDLPFRKAEEGSELLRRIKLRISDYHRDNTEEGICVSLFDALQNNTLQQL